MSSKIELVCCCGKDIVFLRLAPSQSTALRASDHGHHVRHQAAKAPAGEKDILVVLADKPIAQRLDTQPVASPAAASVFISRIRGLPVLDSAGDQVGKVRDVVVQRRTAGHAPRVKGLVVELFARHRIFIPIARVRSIDAMQVMISGVVNTRRFERRESETLVVGDLFDLSVERSDQPGSAVIYDVAMRPVRSHDWELSEVALREGPRKRLGRPGHTTIVDWSAITMLGLDHGQGTDRLLAEMEDMLPADVARELHEMSPNAEPRSLALNDQKLADALEELPEDEQVQLISKLDTERAADILEEMDPDDAADLIADLAPRHGRGAARADGAGGGQGRSAAAQLRRIHRRRHDDSRAGILPPTLRWPTRWPGSATPN